MEKKKRKIVINEQKLLKLMEDLNPNYNQANYTNFEGISPEDQELFTKIFDVQNNFTGMKRGWNDTENYLQWKWRWGYRGGRYWTKDLQAKIEQEKEEFNKQSKNYKLKINGYTDEEGDGEGHIDIPFGFHFTFEPKFIGGNVPQEEPKKNIDFFRE